MEQSNGPIQQPLRAASADPGFIPGLTGAASPFKDAVPRGSAEDAPQDAVKDGDVQDAVPEAEDAVKDAPEAEEAPEASEAAADGPARPAPGDGPSFEAADRRGRIVADAEGVRLSYDEEACEFRWDELAAVESGKGRFGKRFTVTVHTPDRRWYPIDIVAPDRGRIAAWESELDEVLDAYFDETA
ncbi:hypothetical protein ACF1BN_34430 [Streptomyces sp. NPDC014861]|uniref:hypothetical protein n=1 Tax=Streptomyces sp. NPDC014861 TaxID=3364923 RepID=UPI0036FA8450